MYLLGSFTFDMYLLGSLSQRKAMKTLMCKDVSFYLGFEKRIIFIRNLVKPAFALLENNEINI